MIRKILIALSVSVLVLSGCSKADVKTEAPAAEPATEDINESSNAVPTEKTDIKIGVTKGSGSISIAHLLENSADGSAYESYTAEIYDDPNQLMGALAKGDVNAAILPPDKAAKLYNEYDFDCCIAAVSSTCNYYILENTEGKDETEDFADIDGKEIIINETDKMAEPVLDKISENRNISLQYKHVDSNEAVIKSLNETPGALALLQEPYCSQAELAGNSISVIFDLYDYWQEAADCSLATNCLVIPRKFIAQNKEIADLFIKDYAASVSITRHNMEETAKLTEKYSLFDSSEAVKRAIPGCGIGIITGADMSSELGKLYGLLYELSIDSVGRAVPDDNFYYLN